MTYVYALTAPKTTPFVISDMNMSSLSLKTIAMISIMSEAFYPDINLAVISVHCGLHVNIMKKYGLPHGRRMAIASMYNSYMKRGLPIKESRLPCQGLCFSFAPLLIGSQLNHDTCQRVTAFDFSMPIKNSALGLNECIHQCTCS